MGIDFDNVLTDFDAKPQRMASLHGPHLYSSCVTMKDDDVRFHHAGVKKIHVGTSSLSDIKAGKMDFGQNVNVARHLASNWSVVDRPQGGAYRASQFGGQNGALTAQPRK